MILHISTVGEKNEDLRYSGYSSPGIEGAAKNVADFLLRKVDLKVLSSPFHTLPSQSSSFHIANERQLEVPGKCFFPVKEKHFLPKCALLQPLAGNDRVTRTERSGKEENASYAISHQLRLTSRRTDVK